MTQLARFWLLALVVLATTAHCGLVIRLAPPHSGGGVPSAPLVPNADGPLAVWLEHRPVGEEALSPVLRDALADALGEIASQAGWRLCDEPAEGRRGRQPSPACAGVPEANRLIWSGQGSVTVEGAVALLHCTLKLGLRSPELTAPPRDGLFVIQQSIFLPAEGMSEVERSTYLASHLHTMLGDFVEVRRWFERVAQDGGTAVLRSASAVPVAPPSGRGGGAPVGSGSPDPSERSGESDAARVSVEDEEQRILDLLIDDRFVEAARRAEKLLERSDLSEAARRRIRRLRDKAVARFETGPPGETLEPAAGAAVPDEPAPEPFDYSFHVRVARAGEGFRAGTDGRLRVFERGIAFSPNDGEGSSWFVPWSRIEGVGPAPGLWDVRHPIAIETRDGESFFLTERRRDGRFGTGQRLLEIVGQRTAVEGAGEEGGARR